MLPKEKIPVFIQIRQGKTTCICKRKVKCKYGNTCEKDIVERDRYNGWKESFKQDKFGHAEDLNK